MKPLTWLTAIAALTACAALGAACTTDPLPTTTPVFRHQSLQNDLEHDAEGFTRDQGDWLEDYGDAPFYGLAHYAYASPDAAATREARELRALRLITETNLLQGDLQEMTMSALGLIAYVDATGDRSVLAPLDAFIDQLDGLVAAVDYYIQPDLVDSWALRTYGSTSISALLALVNAEYAHRVGGERAPERLSWAREAAARIADKRARRERLGVRPRSRWALSLPQRRHDLARRPSPSAHPRRQLPRARSRRPSCDPAAQAQRRGPPTTRRPTARRLWVRRPTTTPR